MSHKKLILLCSLPDYLRSKNVAFISKELKEQYRFVILSEEMWYMTMHFGGSDRFRFQKLTIFTKNIKQLKRLDKIIEKNNFILFT